MATGYEVDFLTVGSGDRSGDAIAVRYGDPGAYRVMVYDGGTQKSGEELVRLIRSQYQTDHVDYVVNSHPDADHASGLSVVMESLSVGELWMHRPWAYSQVICDYFRDGRITDTSLEQRLQGRMRCAYELEKLAIKNNVPIYEPFQGAWIGDFIVLSPDQDWYVHDLLCRFEKTPEQKTESQTPLLAELLRSLEEAKRKVINWVDAKWDIEILPGGETSAENESTAILFGHLAGHGLLLTGDAGIEALTRAVAWSESQNVSLPAELLFVQVPHHGSRRNVSSAVLDRLLGPRQGSPSAPRSRVAFVSASKGSKTHPRRTVLNAFARRGYRTYPTGDTGSIRWFKDMPARQGFVPIEPFPFFDREEAS